MTIDSDIFSRDASFHGVKGLIRIGDKIIVIRRDSKTFHHPLGLDLPGGGRENSESPFETLAREVHEELQIMLFPSDILYARRYTNTPRSEDDTFFMVTKELDIDEHSIVFGEKGIMYYLMTIHEFIHNPECVDKQRARIIDYLDAVRSELVE